MQLPDETRKQIEAQILGGQKIQAIKTYREATNVDLYHAKTAVEAMEADLKAKSPQLFKAPSGKGCMPMVLLFAGALGLLVFGVC